MFWTDYVFDAEMIGDLSQSQIAANVSAGR